MSVAVDVVVDPSRAREGIEDVKDSFDGLASKASETGKKISSTLGEAMAFGGNTSTALEEINAELEKEARTLDRIKGPAKQYGDRIDELNDLHERGKITTAEWSNEVTKLNRQLAAALPTLTAWDRKATDAANAAKAMSAIQLPKTKGVLDEESKYSKAPGDFGGGLGDKAIGALGAVTSFAAPAAIGGMLLDAAKKWGEVKEAEQQAANVLSKYYDTAGQATEALGEQRDLAASLATTLTNAVGAYDAVRQATSDLYLTSQQQIDVTRNLGRIMEMNNKPVSEAANVMERLQYSITLGTMSSLDFTAIAKQYPDIVNLWSSATGKSVKELRGMADAHQINTKVLRQFVDAIAQGDGVAQNYGKRVLTVAQVEKDLGLDVVQATLYIAKFKEGLDDEASSFVTLDEAMARISNRYAKLRDDVDKANNSLKTTVAIAALTPGLVDAARADRDSKMIDQVVKSLKEAKQDYADLQAMLAQGSIPRNQQSKSLMESIWGRIDPEGLASYKKIVGDLIEPQRTFARDVDTLGGLLADKTINVRQYREEFDKLFAAFAGADMAKLLTFGTKSSGSLGDFTGRPSDAYQPSAFDPGDRFGQGTNFGTEFLEPRYKPSLTLDRALNGDASTFTTIGRPEDLSNNAQYIEQWEEIVRLKQELFEKSNKADEGDLNADLARMEEQLKRNAEATKQWNAELAATRQQNDFIADQLKTTATDLGKFFVDEARKADLSWTTFLKDLENTLGSVLDKIADAIVQAGILYALTGSITGAKGAAVGGGYGGLLGVLFGGAHAGGGAYTVPGAGPPDSRRVLFDLTPGETALFIPPGAFRPGMPQTGGAANALGGLASSAAAGQGSVVNLRVVNQPYDPHGLLEVLDSAQGDHTVMNSMQRNRDGIRAILGIG